MRPPRRRRLAWIVAFIIACVPIALAHAQQPAPPQADAANNRDGGFPHVKVDLQKRQVSVECQALAVDAPLEFFCVVNGTNEHESILRTPAKPSHIHAALLMLGLEPGEPVKYSEAAQKWILPHGPPLNISVEFSRDGKTVRLPAQRMMRDIKTKKSMPLTFHWIFDGSRVMDDGRYAADVNGYAVSIVNFDLTMIDVPELASNSNETLEWERDPDVCPPRGTAVTMIIEPLGDKDVAPSTRPTTEPSGMSDVHLDQEKLDRLREQWLQKVAPHAQALRDAAQTQYEVIEQLRKEQQRLINEADRVQREIDELEKQYQQMTTPRPATQ